MLTIDEREITGPGTGAHPGDGASSFRRILVPARAPDESCPPLAVAARLCGITGGVLCPVHVRTRGTGDRRQLTGDSYSLHVKGAKASGTVPFSL